jgi:hypothetical protein
MSEFTIYTHKQRPELREMFSTFGDVWPEFIYHDEIAHKYIDHTNTTFAYLNLYLCDENDVLVAAGYGVPIVWDGSVETLPSGWDGALEQAVHDYEAQRTPTTFCALGAMVKQSEHGRGLSKYVLRAMKAAAREANLVRMIAPVRPTLKSRYALTPIDRYITWKEADGSPFDPWLRVHWKEGGEIIKTAPRSMVIRGKVAEWEEWTKMRFPESGEYVVPGALEPVSIACERDEGVYVEPNVWMRHGV